MSRTPKVLSRCAALSFAGVVLSCPAAQAGSIALENQLPIPASCVVRSRFGDPFENQQVNPVYEDELFDVGLAAAATYVKQLPIGLWPVQVRLGSFAIAYSVSPLFITLDVECHVGHPGAEGHDHAATFVNPDYWPSIGGHGDHRRSRDARDDTRRSAVSTFRVELPRRAGNYALKTYTPADHTAFLLRLRAADEMSTAAQLLAGAQLAIELSAMPLLYDGSPLRYAPMPLGWFKMVPAPVDAGWPSPLGRALHDAL
ncbi:hypothetical protein GALL_305170 [mine drainage metagenome]|uniref:Uncharacterized protein n=1 Tax=mine drainage metagenome TaxID=410659 RepID=A0A1J5QVD7_9ZZZZ